MKLSVKMLSTAIIVALHVLATADGCPAGCICRSNTAHCESSGLVRFPVNVPPETLHLLLNNNRISEIPEGALARNGQLRSIYVRDNRVSVLQPDAFRALHNLRYLDLGGNNLTTISAGVFAPLKQLTLLNLTRNRISVIKQGAFKGLNSLSELYLSHNQLYNLRSGTFSALGNLNNLCMRANNLRNIPGGIFRRLNNLTHLDLSYNRLRRITSATTNGLRRLDHLDLRGNHIDVLDPHILPPDAKCSQLNDDVKERATRRGCLVSMPELRFIDLSGNDLSRLTYSSFSALTKLVSMSLVDNRWRCDCYLKWALERLRRDHGGDTVAHDQIRCWYPVRYRMVSIEQLHVEDLTPYTNYSDYPDLQHGHRGVWRNKLYRNRKASKSAPTTEAAPDRRTFTSPFPTHLSATSSRVGLSNASLLPAAAARRSRATTQLPGSADAATAPDVTHHVPQSSNGYERTASAGEAALPSGGDRRDPVLHRPPAGSPEGKDYGAAEHPTHQNEMSSWLVGSAIFVSICAAVGCGAYVLRRHYGGGLGCGCCSDKTETQRQSTSESMRSFSNYPLLYDNPLARRPLPRQPLESTQNLRPGTSSMSANRGVDIRWTCGGSFGIGDEATPSVPPRQRRFISRLTASCPPPVVPPRDPVEITWNVERAGEAAARRAGRDARENDDRNAVVFVTGASSYSDVRAGERRRHKVSPRKNYRRSLQIDERPYPREEYFDITPTRHHQRRRQASQDSVSAPVSRNSSGRHGRSSRRSKRDREVSQALGILREIETSRFQHVEQQCEDETQRNYGRKSRTAPEGASSALLLQENLGETCVLGSVAPRRVRRGASARLSGERPVEYFYNSRKSRKSEKASRVARSVSLKQRLSPNIEGIDFEFPPPPPCAHTCSDGSTGDTPSLSEESYDLDLPPPPEEAVFETPTSGSLNLREDASPPSDDYSELALCSSGDATRLRSGESNLRAERQFKSALHRRLDSVDSMHASRDTNCDSLSNSGASSPEHGRSEALLPARCDYSEVRYRSQADRLRSNRDEYRKSMPAFNASVYSAIAGGRSIGESAAGGLGSDGYIYRSVSRYRHDDVEVHFPMNRISRLDLSLSDSEWENSMKRDRCEGKASRRSSLGSTDTITNAEADAATSRSSKPHEKQRAGSESSQGTESVSSIEFGLQGLEEQRDLESGLSGRHGKGSKVGIVPSILVHPTDSSDDVRRLVFNASDLRRLCADVAESSTDDVSTDIEMFDLGTM